MQTTVGLSNTVALDFGRALFGPVGGIIFALMVAISCFGALNGMFAGGDVLCMSRSTSLNMLLVQGRSLHLRD